MNGHNGGTAKLENQRLVELKNEVKMKIIFNIEPVEQARPRATRMGRGIRLYDPKKVSVYKKQLAMMCKFQYKEQSLSCVVAKKGDQARQNQKAKVKTVGARSVNGEKKIN